VPETAELLPQGPTRDSAGTRRGTTRLDVRFLTKSQLVRNLDEPDISKIMVGQNAASTVDASPNPAPLKKEFFACKAE